MSVRIRLFQCIVAVICTLCSMAMGQDEQEGVFDGNALPSPSTQPTAPVPDEPLVWVDVARTKFDGSRMSSCLFSPDTGVVAVERLASGQIGVFLALMNAPQDRDMRVVFIVEQGQRHTATGSGAAWNGRIRMTEYYTPETCPPPSVRSIAFEQRLRQSDPRVRKQHQAEALRTEIPARMPEFLKLSPLPTPVEGKPYPFALIDVNGNRIDGKQLLGKVVILDFWATWCGPCVAELPKIQKLYERYHDEGLQIVGISLDDDPQVVTKFLAEHRVPWPVAVPSKSQREALTAVTGVSAIPEYFVLDRERNLSSQSARGQLEKITPELLARPRRSASATAEPR
jgi:thiol-disulfide isomerase/thioredoxin